MGNYLNRLNGVANLSDGESVRLDSNQQLRSKLIIRHKKALFELQRINEYLSDLAKSEAEKSRALAG